MRTRGQTHVDGKITRILPHARMSFLPVFSCRSFSISFRLKKKENSFSSVSQFDELPRLRFRAFLLRLNFSVRDLDSFQLEYPATATLPPDCLS